MQGPNFGSRKSLFHQSVRMESNRDEALKCLRLAEKYLAEDNEAKAERFAQKSMNMFPNEKAKGTDQSHHFDPLCKCKL